MIRRTIGAILVVFGLSLGYALSEFIPDTTAAEQQDGKAIFRFDTFGDEQLWTDFLRMHEAVATVDPVTALTVGLKVDVEALPPEMIAAIKNGDAELTNPAVTLELLRLNAVVGVIGKVNDGQLTSIGITCAFCHSTVDDSLTAGIGKRLDGWANTDLDVGAIVALSPALAEDEELLGELRSWGPGKYDPRHHVFNGTTLTIKYPRSLPVVIPPIYGLKHVGFETYTGDGPISYWNSYVGVTQMGGQGNFIDPRIDLFIEQSPDLVTPKLGPLLDYQLSLHTPNAPDGSFNRQAANRGRDVFRKEGRCASCHTGPTYTDVLTEPHATAPFLHEPTEIGTEPIYATRSATGKYRTTPLRALWQHAPYFHDGSAADLPAVVEHYNTHFKLNLTAAQKADLVEFLKTL